MNRALAEAIYAKMSPEDQRTLGLIGVMFAFDFGYKMLCSIKPILSWKEASGNE